MQVKEMNRVEIESRLSSMGDYVKMEYLTSCLKENLDHDTRKFVLIRLAGIYELRGMLLEVGKLYRSIAEVNTSSEGRVGDFVKSGEFYVKAGRFDEADMSFGKALALGGRGQVEEVKNAMKEFYKVQAQVYLTKNKRKLAMVTYEKLLTMELSIGEKKAVHEKLLVLYDKLGMVREYMMLRGD
jgi:tetratricopeptide (TPR) repeat protein